jgi:glycine amidinotransferase
MAAGYARDTLLAIGGEVIEASMAWRSRYFEANAFRPIIKEYFRRGARWSAGPKPRLTEEF